ncbi:MAG: class I SAM-dependent methyltransferase [Melioribacteraceae bacterium]
MIDYSDISKSESDLLLKTWGYDLLDECNTMITEANFTTGKILDVATGTGRAVSLLSRISAKVITGDLSFDLKIESDRRISNKHLDRVTYVQLNMERMPFKSNVVENIVCINTLHELDNPDSCLAEIKRISSPNAKLLIADFNSEGFDVLDKVHSIRFNKLHRRGKISTNEIRNFLISSFTGVKEVNTKLNIGFIVTGKKK